MPRVWLLPLILLISIGCGPSDTQVGGEQTKATPPGVISLSPSTTEVVAANGLSGQLRGRTEFCNYPAFVAQLPSYGGVKPDYERLAASRPGLIVYDGSLYSEADKTKLKELGFKIFEVTVTTVKDFEERLRQLGGLLFSPMSMSQYIDKIEAQKSTALTNAPSSPPKVAAITSGTGNDHLIAGSRSFVADVIKCSGGVPVGPDADRFVAANPEALIQSNPDIILVAVQFKDKDQSAAKAAINSILNDPRFAAVSAVKKKAVVPVVDDILLREGSRVDQLIEAIAKVVREQK